MADYVAVTAVTFFVTFFATRYLNRGLDVVEPLAAHQIADTFRQLWSKARQDPFMIVLALTASGVVLFFLITKEFASLGWLAAGFVGAFITAQLNRYLGRYSDLAFGLIMIAIAIAATAYAELHGGGYSLWQWVLVGVGLAAAGALILGGVQAIRGGQRAEQ